jgi:hypothetical protein
LNSLLAEQFDSEHGQELSKYCPAIVSDIVLKTCIWRAGRQAEALRNLAFELLYRLLQILKENHDAVIYFTQSFPLHIFPVILTNMDDDDLSTREKVLLCTDYFLKLPNWNGIS